MSTCACPDDVDTVRDPRLCPRCRQVLTTGSGTVTLVVQVDRDAVEAAVERAVARAATCRVARRGIGW